MSNKLRWKKDAQETGLCRVGAGARGSTLHDGVTRYATVNEHRRNGCCCWFWVAGWGSGVPHYNSCYDLEALTEAEAKAAAMAYVRKHLPTKEQPHD